LRSRSLGDFAETGRHPVPGRCGILAGRVGFFPALVLGVFWKRANKLAQSSA